MMLHSVKRLLRNRKAGPLIEEGMLLGISIVTLTVIISVIYGLLGSVGDAMTKMESSFGDFWGTALSKMHEVANNLRQALHV